MNWRRDGLAVWKPVQAVLLADKKVFFWIKGKLGLSEYQMAGCLGLVERLDSWISTGLLPFLMTMKALLSAVLLLASAAPAALAQKEIPKAEGHDQCPLGYVNTLGTTCVSPIYYEVAPTNGKACKEGWMNIGAGYCKKKKGPLGIL